MTAMIAAAAIGVAGAVYTSNKASKSADRAAQVASNAEQARLDFEREQWDEWQTTYGGIEDSLAAYYETLTPTMRITQGLEAHEKEMNRARQMISENLAQRGISNSGIATQINTELAVSSAEERARIRAAAPLEVAKEKLGFLQVGLGMNPNAGMRDALAANASTAGGIASTAAQNAGAARGAMVSSFTDLAQAGMTAWMNRRNNPPTPTGGSGGN
jgi:hypothetical protein